MESVYVVPRRELFPESYPQGFAALEGDAAQSLSACIAERGFFVERDRAEVEPEWKQVIPYLVVTCPDGVLLLKRTKQGGDARLHDKLSIGVGGHLNPVDAEGEKLRARTGLVARGAQRELHEELGLEVDRAPAVLGLINDDANPVGAVHVGLVGVVRLDRAPTIAETDVLEGQVVSVDELRKMRADGANFETWSALLIDQLHALPLFGDAG